MHLDDEIRYQQDPQKVFDALRDPAFVEEVCRNSGALSFEVDVTDRGGDGPVTVKSRRELPADKVPEPAASLISGRLVVEQTETWDAAAADGSRSGRILVEVGGVPLKFTGKVALRPDGSGARQTLDGELKCAIPILGKKVEKAAEPAIRSGIRALGRTAQAWFG